ncbi:hypothetical protein QBC38DRAFT_188898 [Podospora fimiseda]|uniref:Rhodopsin domain-containing protein n=1 Tax=Podospora fimiseda TaxID=252190 RepID=A0AAN6YLE2_9PEZI|nr:hypothetical protein QBC38DRAFT_188898 [Podospora fimiseda]
MDPSLLSPVSIVGTPYNSLQIGTVVSFAITYFFATFFLVLRYVQAASIIKKVELDLIILTIAYGLALYYMITLVQLMRVGWARHVFELSLSDLIEFNEILLPNTITYLITPAITKMAMLVVLYQINSSLPYRVTIAVMGVCIFAYTLTLTTITGGPCNPKYGAGTTKCLMDVAFAQSILNIASDVGVILAPVPTIISLNLSTKQKMSVAAILFVGSGVVICSIARVPYVRALVTNPDITYQEGILGIWSLVEVNLGIVCGCAMRLKKLIVAWLPKLGLGTSRGKSGSATPFGSAGTTLRGTQGNSQVAGKYQLHSIQKESAGLGSTDKILA